jgi:acyl dehydratase
MDEETMQSFLKISGEDMPAYQNDEAALAMGYKRRIIPPSYGPFLALLIRSFDWEKDFFLDFETGTAVFGEQELEYLRPLYFGETLFVKGIVLDVLEKKGKRLFDVVKMKLTATDENGAIAFHGLLDYILFK